MKTKLMYRTRFMIDVYHVEQGMGAGLKKTLEEMAADWNDFPDGVKVNKLSVIKARFPVEDENEAYVD
jgi:hypothetical protein